VKLQVGFPAKETFREKYENLFSVAFCKLFRKISHFFAKINEANKAEIFTFSRANEMRK